MGYRRSLPNGDTYMVVLYMKTPWNVALVSFPAQLKTLTCNRCFKEGMSQSQNLTDTACTSVLLSGSTHILTPRRLLEEVKSLNKPKDMVCIKDE